MNLDLLPRARAFPVRHHSPRATRALASFLDEVEPRAVLVEGPEDASRLIDVLVDEATEPPVAVLGYRTEGSPSSALWPFAAYSPEYAALRWARGHGVPARFIDLPTSRTLAREEDEGPGPFEAGPPEIADPGEAPAATTSARPAVHPFTSFAREHGFRSFDELWEARFEAPGHTGADFARLIGTFAGWSRALDRRPIDRVRDAYMAQRLLQVLDEEELEPEQVVLVLGAAHVAAFAEKDVDAAALDELPPEVASEVTLIPFSFLRLAEQLGYGAGNRAPLYYQRAHDAGCDFRRASLEVLVEATEGLRLRGFAVSLADTIEAYRLALRLAELRDKAQPGLDEVREGAIATLFRGDSGLVDELLWPAVVGKRVGRVASRIGRNSLQQEFWNEVKARRLPEHDEPETFTLQLHNEVEVGSSIFLHRLRVADIPYATFVGSRQAYGGSHDEAAGGIEALRRVREIWEAQWTPATDVALAESIALGDSLAQVAARRLGERLEAARSTGEAAEVLLEAVVASCPQPAARALEACDRFSAGDDDLPSLARACQALSGLVSFGTSRGAAGATGVSGGPGDEAVERLCLKTFDRSVLRLGGACVVEDEGLTAVKGALRALHEVATSQALIDKEAWLDAARNVAASYAVHPVLSGLAAGLLLLAQALDEEGVAQLLEQRLSDVGHPERAGGFLDGFLEVNALVLVRNRELVRLLDRFLGALPGETFRNELPVLRRAFSRLGQTERRYLLENVVGLRGLGRAEEQVKEIMSGEEAETLEALDDEVSDALADLDELL